METGRGSSATPSSAAVLVNPAPVACRYSGTRMAMVRMGEQRGLFEPGIGSEDSLAHARACARQYRDARHRDVSARFSAVHATPMARHTRQLGVKGPLALARPLIGRSPRPAKMCGLSPRGCALTISGAARATATRLHVILAGLCGIVHMSLIETSAHCIDVTLSRRYPVRIGRPLNWGVARKTPWSADESPIPAAVRDDLQ